MTKYVYAFTEGDGQNKHLLGEKGANLCDMTQIGLNVPPGFVISTQACLAYLKTKTLPDGLLDEIKQHIQHLEKVTGKGFGDPDNPLLVSVRSGAAVPIPGMMDTILNLGLNAQTLGGLIKHTHNERFGYDAYRRFIQLFGRVALNIDAEYFEHHFNAVKARVWIKDDNALREMELEEISNLYLEVVREKTGKPFPEDVYEQLEIAVKAAFHSWVSPAAITHRNAFNIDTEIAHGTAVNVVTMVFGNMGNNSATGVGFTRNPISGANQMYGEYLVNAQGEDVVAGIRTPKPVQNMEQEMPDIYTQLMALRAKLEAHYREVQDYAYTIENGVLYCLQTRTVEDLNATAMVRSSVDMVEEGLLTKEQALLRVNPQHLEQLLHPRLDPHGLVDPIATGLPASPGAAVGKCIFDADRAVALSKKGENVILVREETKPDDIHGFFAAQGILTSRGGKTSHAAVVARSMDKVCVTGAEGIQIDSKKQQARVGGKILSEGTVITIDGNTGNVYWGEIATIPPQFSPALHTLLDWADEVAQVRVMANADTPDNARRARQMGAQGIGLCRTERMFNESDRLPIVVKMILAHTVDERQAALSRLLPFQRGDFKAIFSAMGDLPVTIRLLDLPMHEFLPSEQQLLDELEKLYDLRRTVSGLDDFWQTMQYVNNADIDNTTLLAPFNQQGAAIVEQAIEKKQQMLRKARELFEVNPMLGHRGVRLGITYPEIYTMQIRAILEAMAECQREEHMANVKIMAPQVATVEELREVKRQVETVKVEVEKERNVALKFAFGTMIEVVRACMRAEELAKEADFFSFGTNDLTQATFSFSREDAENKFLPQYKELGLMESNPFEVLDVKGVGQLMEMTVEWGRKSHSGLNVGICGEHGGHPESVRYCHHIDLDYVSCSAPRVPIARLAAAHAKLLEDKYQVEG